MQRRVMFLCVLLLLSSSLYSQQTVPPIPGRWYNQFGIGASSGADGGGSVGQINAIVEDSVDIIVGGTFQQMGGVLCNNIARYDKQKKTWNAFGNGVVVAYPNVVVNALYMIGDLVFVGGQFLSAGGVSVENFAIWNRRTEQWSFPGAGIGAGSSITIKAFAVLRDTLFIGGTFGIKYFNLATMKFESGSATSSNVNALYAAGNDLYAAGEFTSIGGVSALRIARYNRLARKWFPLAGGLNSTVSAVVVKDTSVYAGGQFTQSGSIPNIRYIARFDTASKVWTGLANSTTDGFVMTLEVYNGMVVAGGAFTKIDTLSVGTSVAAWDGTRWRSVYNPATPNLRPPINIRVLKAGLNNTLHAGGSFFSTLNPTTDNSVRTNMLFGYARWDGTEWTSTGLGAGNPVYQTLVDGDYLYAAGVFTNAGPTNATMVARLHIPTNTWEELGVKLDGPWNNVYFSNTARALAIKGTTLYVAGNFTKANGTAVQGLIQIDLSTKAWSAVPGATTISYANDGIYCMAVHDNMLYAGGGNVFGTSFLRKFDGTTWTDFTNYNMKSYVYDMAFDHDTLYIAGSWGPSGSGYEIAKHNPAANTWSRVGGRLLSLGRAVAISPSGEVWAGGDFSYDYDQSKPISCILRLKNGVWVSPPHTLTGSCYDITFRGDTLVAVGSFSFKDTTGTTVYNVAVFDGKYWRGLPNAAYSSGGPIRSVVNYRNSLIFGGEFYDLGAAPARYLARYDLITPDGPVQMMGTSFAGMNEFAPTLSKGKGFLTVYLDAESAVFSGSITGMDSSYASAWLYSGLPGSPGTKLTSLYGTSTNNGKDVKFYETQNTLHLDPSTLAAIRSGNVFVRITTVRYVFGELRGQILPLSNAAPSKPAALAPLNGSSLTLAGNGDSTMSLTWSAASDPDANPVAYVLQASRQPTFAVLLVNRQLGTSPVYTLTKGGLDDYLRFAGVPLNTPTNLYFRMIATDGSLYTISDTATVSFTRGGVSAHTLPLLGNHTFANKTVVAGTNGRAIGVGDNYWGALGRGSDETPMTTPGLVTAPAGMQWKLAACSQGTTYFLTTSGRIFAAGSNSYYMLGTGEDSWTSHTTPVQIAWPAGVDTMTFKFIDVSAGQYHGAALGNNGRIYTWGKYENGRLGQGVLSSDQPAPAPVYFPATVDSSTFRWTKISSGGPMMLALGSDSMIYGWGYNQNGNLGIGVKGGNYWLPVRIKFPSGVDTTGFKWAFLSAGNEAACAIGNNGKLYRWGSSWNPQPTLVAPPTGIDTTIFAFSFVSTGIDHILAIGNNGRMYATGGGYSGKLGTGTETSYPSTWAAVLQPSDVVGWAYAAAGWDHSIAISTDGELWVWGGNSINQLGLDGVTRQFLPVKMGGIVLGVGNGSAVPQKIELSQNYPNPFNPTTTIRASLPSRTRVSLKVYDIVGREVMTAADGEYAPGTHLFRINASRLSSGVYFYQLRAGSFVQAKKMVVLK